MNAVEYYPRTEIMRKKIYFIQPTYCDQKGQLLKGRNLFIHSLALPALSAAVSPDWQKEFCLEFFEDVNYDTDLLPSKRSGCKVAYLTLN
jgi:hypothetical protein